MTLRTRFTPSLTTAAAALLASSLSMPLVAQYVSDSATIADRTDKSKANEAVWPQDSCEKLQQAAGAYIYLSGEFLKEADQSKDPAVKKSSFGTGAALSQLSANAANIYEVFCKS